MVSTTDQGQYRIYSGVEEMTAESDGTSRSHEAAGVPMQDSDLGLVTLSHTHPTVRRARLPVIQQDKVDGLAVWS